MKNFKHLAITVAVALSILVPAALPTPAQAVDQAKIIPGTTEYSTEMKDIFTLSGAGAYTGSLELTISESGMVRGWYRPTDGSIEAVTGGVSNGNMWFSIGTAGSMRFTGSLEGNTIVGSVRQSEKALSALSFVAKASR